MPRGRRGGGRGPGGTGPPGRAAARAGAGPDARRGAGPRQRPHPAGAGAGPPPEPAAPPVPAWERLPAAPSRDAGAVAGLRRPDPPEPGEEPGHRGELARVALAPRAEPAALPVAA